MEFLNEKNKVTDVLAKVLSAVPAGLVFDDVYIVEQFCNAYPDSYRQFCARYGDSEKPMEMVGGEIARLLETFEGVLVERQTSRDTLPTFYTRHKLWKKI
jgi:hypothetical protein